MESIELRIERDGALQGVMATPFGEIPMYQNGTRYTLRVTDDGPREVKQVTIVISRELRGVPNKYIARELVERLVADYRDRIMQKVLSAL